MRKKWIRREVPDVPASPAPEAMAGRTIMVALRTQWGSQAFLIKPGETWRGGLTGLERDVTTGAVRQVVVPVEVSASVA